MQAQIKVQKPGNVLCFIFQLYGLSYELFSVNFISNANRQILYNTVIIDTLSVKLNLSHIS